jgi:hypothetical protein
MSEKKDGSGWLALEVCGALVEVCVAAAEAVACLLVV